MERKKSTTLALKLQPGVASWLLIPALAALLLYFPGGVAAGVWSGEGFTVDRTVMQAIHRQATFWLTPIMRLITDSASGPVTAVLVLGLSIRWCRARRRAAAFFLIVTLMASSMLGGALDHFFARPRTGPRSRRRH